MSCHSGCYNLTTPVLQCSLRLRCRGCIANVPVRTEHLIVTLLSAFWPVVHLQAVFCNRQPLPYAQNLSVFSLLKAITTIVVLDTYFYQCLPFLWIFHINIRTYPFTPIFKEFLLSIGQKNVELFPPLNRIYCINLYSYFFLVPQITSTSKLCWFLCCYTSRT